MKRLVFLSFFSFLGLLFFTEPLSYSRNIKPVYFAPPSIIKYFSFGFSDFYADLLWIRVIQDIDFCSTEKGLPVYDGEYKYQCQMGWSYKMVDALTELSPRFLKAYRVSGSIMSVIMRDKQGARKIYDKGLKVFPKDWRLNYAASYHYLLEIKDKKKAADLMITAADNGAPSWLYALAARQHSELGEYFFAKKILTDFLKQYPEGQFREHIKKRLQEIKNKQSADAVFSFEDGQSL